MPEQYITIAGNLVDDPELRFTPNGHAVCKFRVVVSDRKYDKATNEWKDGDPWFVSCQIWRQAAENVAESLSRGSRVVVMGRIKQHSYETKEGEKRTVIDLECDDVGASMKWATVKITKMSRSGAGTNPDTGKQFADDKWTSNNTEGKADTFADEPPF